jgi:thioesterase domain-containing protein/acyl carrier protein
MARCQARLVTFDDAHRTRQEEFFDFGPRWHSLRAIHLGVNEFLAALELPAAFHGDTSDYLLHPALLDLATGCSLYLIDDYGSSSSLYFPMFYKRAVIYRRIPSRIFSHVRSSQRNEAGREVAAFDLSLLDEEGRMVGEIEGFSMRLVRDPGAVGDMAAATVPVSLTAQDRLDDDPVRAITPAEGARAFTRIVSSEGPAGIFVLPDGAQALTPAPQVSVAAASRRPSLGDDVESVIAEWWQELLGLDRVGLDDDFFELGGQSLVVVRLFTRIKKTYGVDLALSTLFEARTVRTLSQHVRDARSHAASEPAPAPALVAIQTSGTCLPLFVIPGLDVDVGEFRAVASYLGADQPVYAFSLQDRPGDGPAGARVEEIAAHCAGLIRSVQTEGPYRLMGHSFGGVIAFEVAQLMRAEGGDVSFLGMLDTLERRSPMPLERARGFRAHSRAPDTQHTRARPGSGPLRNRLFLKSVSSLRRLLGMLRHPRAGRNATTDAANAANYQPTVYPGRLTLFRTTSPDAADGNDKFLGWGDLVSGGIHVHELPSERGTVLHEPGVRIFSQKLRECLDCCPAPAPAVTGRAAE